MLVEYVAYNRAGERVTGVLEVESLSRATDILWDSGHIIVKVRGKVRRPSLAQLLPTLFGVKSLDIIVFSRELASLLDSGISLLPSLRILYAQVQKPAFRDALRSIIRDIEEGNSFSLACSRQSAVFPAFYTRLLRVAEETGELSKILIEVSGYMEKQRLTAAKVRKALTYPSFVLVLGMGAVLLFLTYSLPSLVRLLGEYAGELPLITRLMLKLSGLVQAYGKYVLPAVVFSGVWAWLYFRTPSGKKKRDRITFKMPLVGRAIQQSQIFRLCSTLSTLLFAGIPAVEALRLTRDATENSIIRQGLTGVDEEISAGSALEPAFVKQGVFPALFSQAVGVGEETGTLKTSLRNLATFYEQETDRALARATDMIEPVVIVTVGIMVGFVAMSVVSGMYSILPQIR